MADDSWLDDPSLYKPKASSSDSWLDDPQLYKPAKKVEKPGFGETLLKGLQRGGADAIASTIYTVADALDASVQAPARALAPILGDTFRDPLGAGAIASENMGVRHAIDADRQSMAQRIGGRPSWSQVKADPLGSAKQYGLNITNAIGESAPLMAAAIATRNPVLGSAVMGGAVGAQEYTGLRGQGVGRAEAAQAAGLTAAIESAGESFSLPLVLGARARGSLRNAILAESVQEAPVQIAQQYVEDQTLGTQTPIGQQLGDAFDAAITGGVMGGGGHLIAGGSVLGEIPPEELGAAARAAAPKADAPQTSAIDPAILAAGNEALARAAKNAPPATAPRDPAVAPDLTDDIDALLARNLPPTDLPPAAPAPANPSIEGAGVAATPDIDWNAAAAALGIDPGELGAAASSLFGDGTTPAPVLDVPRMDAELGAPAPVLDTARIASLLGLPSEQAQQQVAAPEPAAAEQPAPQPLDAPIPEPSRFGPLDLRQEIGWSQRGGELVRAPVDSRLLNAEQRYGGVAQPKGEVIGRTRWIGWPAPDGTESTFWRTRPDRSLTEKQANEALDKFERGEKLRPIEQRFIDHAKATAAEYDRAMQLQEDAERGYSEVERQAALADMRAQHDINVLEADSSEALSLYELARRAAERGVDDFDITQAANESNQAYAARLWKLIEEADRGTDTGAAAEDRAGGDQGREGGPQRIQERGFQLAQQPAPEARQADQVAPSAGLFGAPTTRDFIDAAKRGRDAARNGQTGTGRTDMLAGDGELFAGPRPEQARVDAPAPTAGEGPLESVESDPLAEAARNYFGTTQDPREAGYILPDGAMLDFSGRHYADDHPSLRGQRSVDHRELTGENNKGESLPFNLQSGSGSDYMQEFMARTSAMRVDFSAGVASIMGEPTPQQIKTLARGLRGDYAVLSVIDPKNGRIVDEAEIDNPTPMKIQRFFAKNAGKSAPDNAPLFSTDARARGEEAADLLEIRDAVDRVVGPGRVIYLSDHTGLPDRLRNGVESRMARRGGKGRTAALYDPQTKQVYLFTDVVTDPKRAVWHVMHEIAGHHGLREFLGDKLAPALEIALQNPTVKRVAEAIAKERNIDMASQSGRLLAAEEALAELAAAVRTGNFDAITSRYKVEVPDGIRASVAKAVENFVKRLKKLLDDMFGRPMFTDEDVRALLENAWQAARNGGEAAIGQPDALESVGSFNESAYRPQVVAWAKSKFGSRVAPNGRPAWQNFVAWFGDSKVVDKQGRPLVVYHGTNADFAVFDPVRSRDAGVWFTPVRGAAEMYGANIIPAFVSLRNPYEATVRQDRAEALMRAADGGHDGLIVRDTDGSISTLSVFHPEQIKSATGNRGTFDPSNPSILESVEYTPEQEAALTKAGLQVDRRTSLQRTADSLREKWRSVRDTLRDAEAMKQAVFDRFHGLRHAEARLGLNDPEVSAYIAARMSAGLDAVMEAMLSFGAPVWDGGVLAIKDGTVGLLDALKPVEGMVDEWLGWMVGRRAKLLKSQGRENNLTDDDIAALLSLADGREQAFQQAARDYLKIKNAVLDVAEQAGLIDPSARAVWDHAEYIPFYRAEGDGSAGPGTRKGLQGQTSGIRTLKGGDQALADPLANIIRNFTKLVDASMKNRAVLLAVDNYGNQVFEKVGMDMAQALVPMDQVKKHLREQGTPESVINALPAGTLKGVQRMLSIVPPSAEDVVRVMRDGKAEYYRVKDPLVLRALTAFKQPDKNIAIKPFIWFKRLLTTGVTVTPEFIAANFIRDSGSAWVISDDRFKPGWDSMRGVFNTLRNDQTTREMMMAGSTFLGGQFYDGNPDKAANAIRRALRSKGMSNRDIEGFIGTIASARLKLWDGYLKLSGAVENANRRAVFDAAIKAGRTRTEAAYMARDLMDFAMQGDAAWVQLFSDILPFFNARLQGLYKLGRRAGTKQGKRAILLRGGVIALASVALYAWNLLAHSDGWDELEEWDKDAYWHVAPGTPYHIRIPKPFELGLLFGTAPERGMEAIRNRINQAEGDKPETTLDALIRAITGTLAFNPVPQAALPIAEQWANKRSFTGRPIEDMGDEKLLPEDRKEWYTSDTMKALGRMSGISPKRLEHIWNGYTAGLGGYILDVSDVAVRMLEGAPDRPGMNLSDMPLVGRFARGGSPGRTKYAEQFYERLRKGDQIEQSIKSRLEAGDEAGALKLERENAGLLGERIPSKRAKGGFLYAKPRAMRKVRGELSGIRDEIEAIATSRNMSAEEKRQQINALEERRNKVFRDAVKSAGQ